MIVYEAAGSPTLRTGETILAGRRIAGRLLPYGAGSGVVAFDPVERRFVLPRDDAALRPGPPRAESWREALARIPAGPVLIGPCAAAEAIWGAGRAAAEAALGAGRPLFLLDPEPEAMPPGAAEAAVVLCAWRPGDPRGAFPGIGSARAAGARCAAIFPLIPGWTTEDGAIEALADAALRGGAASFTAVLPAADGEGRRDIVEARSRFEPGNAERFFELIHHADWSERMARFLDAASRAASDRGLRVLPPRPEGRREPAGNRRAAASLEERAELSDPGEHRAALLYAAVRWIDESPRDLAAVAREGNFLKVFPFDGEIGAWTEAALREGPG
jgi:hypothetical protein